MTFIALCGTWQSRALKTDGRMLPSTLSPSFAADNEVKVTNVCYDFAKHTFIQSKTLSHRILGTNGVIEEEKVATPPLIMVRFGKILVMRVT